MRMIPPLLLLLFSSIAAHAGNETGNGGNGILCTDPQSGEERAELLDLWNGEAHGLTIAHTNDVPMQTQLDAVITRFGTIDDGPVDPSMIDEIRGGVKEAMSAADYVSDPDFPVAGDDGITSVPENCHLFGVGSYQDGFWFKFLGLGKGKLRVQQSAYDSLSFTDQAAFWLHEGLYRLQRQARSEDNSLRAQQCVAIGFSTAGWDTPLWPLTAPGQ